MQKAYPVANLIRAHRQVKYLSCASHNPPCDLSPACQHDGRMLKSPMFRYNSRKPMHPKLRYHPQFKNESRKSEKLGGIYFHSFCICFIWSDGGLSQQYWLDPHSSTHPPLQLIPTLTAIWPRAIPTSTILSRPKLRATPALQPLPHPSRDLRTRPPKPNLPTNCHHSAMCSVFRAPHASRHASPRVKRSLTSPRSGAIHPGRLDPPEMPGD
jgi:hypothetical protein